MTKLETSRPFPNKTADQIYAGFEAAFRQAGFDPWKLRPIGWLVMAKCLEGGSEIQANLSARPGNPASALLLMTSDRHAAAELQPLAEAIWQALTEKV
jgi:hypothetical protein